MKYTGFFQIERCKNDNTIIEKYALLHDGDDHLIYTYNTITTQKVYYMEIIPWYKSYFCCGII